MRITRNYKKIIAFILLAVFVAACASASPTPIVTVSTPTALPPTAARFVTDTSLLPTMTLPMEKETDNQDNSTMLRNNQMNIQIGDAVLTATLVENSSVDALKEALSKGPITINMRDYGGMEKVGPLGMDLPTNNEQITTEAGDIILYQGNAFVIYYAPNSWNFTRLGRINNISAKELKEILGNGNVTITLSLPQE